MAFAPPFPFPFPPCSSSSSSLGAAPAPAPPFVFAPLPFIAAYYAVPLLTPPFLVFGAADAGAGTDSGASVSSDAGAGTDTSASSDTAAAATLGSLESTSTSLHRPVVASDDTEARRADWRERSKRYKARMTPEALALRRLRDRTRQAVKRGTETTLGRAIRLLDRELADARRTPTPEPTQV